MSIQGLSRILSMLSLLPLLGIPSIWVYFLWQIDAFAEIAMANAAFSIQWNTVVPYQLYIVCLMQFAVSMILVWGIYSLRKVFVAFTNGEVFVFENILNIKRFSATLILTGFGAVITTTLASVILSLNHPAGQKTLAISIGGQEIWIMMIGLTFWLIAKILREASLLKNENNQFV